MGLGRVKTRAPFSSASVLRENCQATVQYRIRTRTKIGKVPICAAIFLLRFSRREFSHRVGHSRRLD
jgi:hypothetical protein